MGTGGDAEGGVLDGLDLGYCRWGGVREPDWGGESDYGFDEGFEGDEEGLFLMSPAGARQGFEDI